MQDYLGILEHLLKRWNVGHLTGLSSEAAEAQDRVCNLPARYRWVLYTLCTSSSVAWKCNRAAIEQALLVTWILEACECVVICCHPLLSCQPLFRFVECYLAVHSSCSACPGLGLQFF